MNFDKKEIEKELALMRLMNLPFSDLGDLKHTYFTENHPLNLSSIHSIDINKPIEPQKAKKICEFHFRLNITYMELEFYVRDTSGRWLGIGLHLIIEYIHIV